MASVLVPQSATPAAPVPPKARAVPHSQALHGDVRTDEFRWLRERSDPEVLAYLEAENRYTEEMMRHTLPLQEALHQEMLGRIRQDDQTVPYHRDGWWYYARTEAGKSYPIFCRRRGSPVAAEEIYLDQNVLAEGHEFHAMGGMDVSPDGRRLIYLEDLTGFRDYILVVKDLETGAELERFAGVWNGTAWADDSETFFYMTADAAKRGDSVWRHRIGTPRSADQRVYHEPDVLFDVAVARSRSGRWILIETDSFSSAETWLIPAADPAAPPRVVAPRRAGVEYRVEPGDGYFLITTNHGARNFRIFRAPEDQPAPAHWTEWLPERESVFVESVEAFRDFVVVSERSGGLRRFRVTALDTGDTSYIPFPEAAYAVFHGENHDFTAGSYRFRYSSFITPTSVLDYHVAGRQSELRKRSEIPSGFDPAAYEVRRFLAPARDGAEIPVSILGRRGSRQDGSAPLLLHGYGAYGVTMEPAFSSEALSLVDRGFSYAMAHIRGGLEMGREWYDAGKMERKENSFNDFIDVAETLVARGYTRPDRLVAGGASAGGLLMGVLANRRPDLFRAIVADVPFVDVLNTMLDPTLPLTAQEWEQWGDPRNPEHYACLRRYSPYDNVAAQAYPWLLVTTSLNDSQVMYWEPAKWVARLRATKTDVNPLLLKTNLAGGHGGASGRYARLRDIAFHFAFMLEAVGLGR